MALPETAWQRARRLAQAGASAAAGLVGGKAEAAARLADGLGDLRGLATKVGQMASYIEGFTPDDPAVAAAFTKLRASAATSDPAAIRAVVEAELGKPVDAVFEAWADEALASASLGQVHRARWRGRDVAVKVQHPGMEAAVAADLGQADRVAAVVGALAQGVPVAELVVEIRARLADELDYRLEAAHQAAYSEAFRDDPVVVVPEVIGACSARRVLTTAFSPGVPLETAIEGASSATRAAWARALWRVFALGGLRTGRLHGDPHPGNVLVEGERLVVLDYGCVQPLDADAQAACRAMWSAASRGEAALRDHLRAKLGDGRVAVALTDAWVVMLRPAWDGPVRVDRATAKALTAAILAAKHPSNLLRRDLPSMEPWWVLMHRTQVGLISVLAKLDVEADYRGEGAIAA